MSAFIYRKLPPGPWSIFPFLGVVYKINQERPHLTYTEWVKKYGDILSFTVIGTQRAVVVSSEEAIRDLLKQDQFSGINLYIAWRSVTKSVGHIITTQPSGLES